MALTIPTTWRPLPKEADLYHQAGRLELARRHCHQAAEEARRILGPGPSSPREAEDRMGR